MNFYEYANFDVTQQPTVPRIPVATMAQPTVKAMSDHALQKRLFRLRLVAVLFVLLVELSFFVVHDMVSSDTIQPPWKFVTPTVAPCAHTTLYFSSDGSNQSAYADESCP